MFAGTAVDEDTAARFEAAGVPPDLPQKPFKLEENILDGNSEYDIAQFLAHDAGLSFEALEGAGLTPSEIIHRLTPSRGGGFWDYAGEGVVKGLLPGATFFPGAYYGGAAGALVGGPPGALFGGALGGLAASIATGAALDYSGIWEKAFGPEDVLPEGFPVVEGGYTVGVAASSLRLPWTLRKWAAAGGDFGSEQFLKNLAKYSGRTDAYAQLMRALGAPAQKEWVQRSSAFMENVVKRMVEQRITPGPLAAKLPYVGDAPFNAGWLAADMSGIASMGVAGMAAVEHDPTSIGLRFVAETAAGFINPGSIIGSQAHNIKTALNRIWHPVFSKPGTQNTASRKLNDLFNKYGEMGPEEMDDLIRRLADDDEIGLLLQGIEDEEFRVDVPVIDPATKQVRRVQVDAEGKYVVTDRGEYIDDPSGEPLIIATDPRTPAMKVGSFFPALRNIERSMAASNAALSERINERAHQSTQGLRHLLSLMVATGDRELIAQAMMLRDKAFGEIISGRLNQAVQEALQLSQAAIIRGSETAANSGVRIHKALNTVFGEARAQERALYDVALHTDEIIVPEHTVAAYQELVNQGYTSMTEMPPGISFVIRAMTEDGIGDDLAALAVTAQKSVTKAQSAVDLERSQAGSRIEGVFNQHFVDATDDAGNLDRGILRDILKEDLERFSRRGLATTEQSPFALQSRVNLSKKQLDLMHYEDELSAINQKIRMGDDVPDKIPLNEMSLTKIVQFRSSMLAKARSAGADPAKLKEAGVYSKMANAALRDIGLKVTKGLPTDPAKRAALIEEIGEERVGKLEALGTAYAFSRRFNDVFTRSLLGNIFDYEKSGAAALTPEVTAQWLFKGNVNEVTLKLADVDRALTFLTNQSDTLGLDVAKTTARRMSTIGRTMSLRVAEEQYLRSLAQKFVNAETGEIKTGQLATYLQEFDHVLDAYPMLKRDLSNAQTAQTLLLGARRDMGLAPGVKSLDEAEAAGRKVTKAPPWRGSHAERRYFNELAWTKIVGAENPSLVLKGIVGAPDQRSANAAERVDDVIKSAKKMAENKDFVDPVTGITVTSKDLMNGLKSSLLDGAWLYADGAAGGFNATKFHDYLFKPLGRGKPSLITKMRQHELISDSEAVRMNTLIRGLQDIEKAMPYKEATGVGGFATVPADVIEDLHGSALFKFWLALTGSAMGSTAGRFTQTLLGRGPVGLIERSAGSTAIQKIFDKVPAMYARDIMQDAFEDGRVLSLLLQKIDDPKEAFRWINRLNSYLISSGVVLAENIVPPPPESWKFSTDPEKRDAAFNFYGGPSLTERHLLTPETPKPVTPEPPPPDVQPVTQAPPAPPIAQAPSPEQRSRFAAMFPGDITSGLIRQQDVNRGIGSLA